MRNLKLPLFSEHSNFQRKIRILVTLRKYRMASVTKIINYSHMGYTDGLKLIKELVDTDRLVNEGNGAFSLTPKGVRVLNQFFQLECVWYGASNAREFDKRP
jgi:predicted transcriptional regulator